MLFRRDGWSRVVTWGLIAIVGGVCGFMASAGYAKACSCAMPAWRLRLVSVTSNVPSVDHRQLWADTAMLTSDWDQSSFGMQVDATRSNIIYVQ